MLNSRQRAQLRGLANSLDTIFQIGKGGVTENTVKQVDDALEARELIKLRVLETSPVSSREAADEIAAADPGLESAENALLKKRTETVICADTVMN